MTATLSPSLSIGGIDCSLSLGDDGRGDVFGESWPSSGPEASAEFRCAWTDRYALARALMGSSTSVGGVILQVPPYAWPESPNIFCAALGTIRGEVPRILQVPEGRAPAGWMAFTRAVIPARFSVPRYDIPGTSPDPPKDPSGRTYTSTRFQLSGEVFTPPNGTFYYQDGGAAWVPVHDSLLGIIRPRVEISMTRHWLPWNFDLEVLMRLIGGVNSYPVQFTNRTFPRGTLLFGGFSATEQVDSLGERSYDIECGMLGNYDVEWNELMGQDSEWHLVNSQDDGLGDTPFPYIDFGDIP